MIKPVNRLMEKGVKTGVFPGAVLLVSKNGTVVHRSAYGMADLFSSRKMRVSTVFDLASLTKPLATSLAVLSLVKKGALTLDEPVSRFIQSFKNGPKSLITPRLLLCHCSGFPAWRPYYNGLIRLDQSERKKELIHLLTTEPLCHGVGKKSLYSDLGFMLLSRIIETASGTALDQYVMDHVYGPMGIKSLFFPGDEPATRKDVEYAATELSPLRNRLLIGEVHDDNAWAVGGVDGHAGLFGTAEGIHELLCDMGNVLQQGAGSDVLPAHLLGEFLGGTPGNKWALGFDRPAEKGSSAGRHFSRNSIGHLGFTGVSFWMDLNRAIIVILLSNRVHPFRFNFKIRKFRPALHDLIMESREIAEN